MHFHIEVFVPAKTKEQARQELEELMDVYAPDYWLVGGQWSRTHELERADSASREAPETNLWTSERQPATFGPFVNEQPSDLLSLDDPRADRFMREGRCFAVWWRTPLEVQAPLPSALPDTGYEGAHPSNLMPSDLLAELRANRTEWWLATVDMHY